MEDEVNPTYPSQYETEVLLKDGSRILLRPIKQEDTERWLALFRRLSQETKILRFHRDPGEMGPEDALRFCTVDYKNTFALVAEVQKGKGKEIVAVGRYYRLPKKHVARVAFAIEDAYHGLGIGTRLIEWLANIARDNGIKSFEGDILAENERMMNVLRDYGFHIESELKGGVYHVTIPITRSRRVERKEEERADFNFEFNSPYFGSALSSRDWCFPATGQYWPAYFPVYNAKRFYRGCLSGESESRSGNVSEGLSHNT